MEVLSSDEDVELPEINVSTVLGDPPSRGRRPAASQSDGSQLGSQLGSQPARRPSHRLGTGGHPALEDHFDAQPAKRKKQQRPPGVFVRRK